MRVELPARVRCRAAPATSGDIQGLRRTIRRRRPRSRTSPQHAAARARRRLRRPSGRRRWLQAGASSKARASLASRRRASAQGTRALRARARTRSSGERLAHAPAQRPAAAGGWRRRARTPPPPHRERGVLPPCRRGGGASGANGRGAPRARRRAPATASARGGHAVLGEAARQIAAARASDGEPQLAPRTRSSARGLERRRRRRGRRDEQTRRRRQRVGVAGAGQGRATASERGSTSLEVRPAASECAEAGISALQLQPRSLVTSRRRGARASASASAGTPAARGAAGCRGERVGRAGGEASRPRRRIRGRARGRAPAARRVARAATRRFCATGGSASAGTMPRPQVAVVRGQAPRMSARARRTGDVPRVRTAPPSSRARAATTSRRAVADAGRRRGGALRQQAAATGTSAHAWPVPPSAATPRFVARPRQHALPTVKVGVGDAAAADRLPGDAADFARPREHSSSARRLCARRSTSCSSGERSCGRLLALVLAGPLAAAPAPAAGRGLRGVHAPRRASLFSPRGTSSELDVERRGRRRQAGPSGARSTSTWTRRRHARPPGGRPRLKASGSTSRQPHEARPWRWGAGELDRAVRIVVEKELAHRHLGPRTRYARRGIRRRRSPLLCAWSSKAAARCVAVRHLRATATSPSARWTWRVCPSPSAT